MSGIIHFNILFNTLSEDPRLIGFPTAWGPISEFETKVIPQLLNNAESWLGIKESNLKILQDFQDNLIRKVFQVSAKGTPKGMIRLDSQILPMKWKIVLAKIRTIAKTMGKPSDNLCRMALIEGQRTCNGEDLLTEYICIVQKIKREMHHRGKSKCNGKTRNKESHLAREQRGNKTGTNKFRKTSKHQNSKDRKRKKLLKKNESARY